MNSGLYIVTLNNTEPIHVNAQDPRDKGRSITVTKVNCKFGKARDFERRKRNYYKTFGKQNVNFFPIVAMEEIECIILKELDQFRIKGSSGRKTEWLENTSYEQVKSIIYHFLQNEDALTFKIF